MNYKKSYARARGDASLIPATSFGLPPCRAAR